MKLNGRTDLAPSVEVVVLPRDPIADADGNVVSGDIVFKCKAVNSMKEFEKLCPEPTPPKTMKRSTGRFEANEDDPAFKQALQEHGQKRLAFMILKSLEATPGLEWDKVDLATHSTWTHWENELRDAGITDVEINRITLGVMRANALDDTKLEEARKRFLELESRGSEAPSA